MAGIQFEPVTEHNLDVFIRVTRETLWLPVYPGDQAIAREFQRWPPHIRKNTLLIAHGPERIGRVIAPQFDDYLLIRDLGVRAERELITRTTRALLERAAQRRARIVRAIVHEPYWFAFSATGFREQKQRTVMHCSLPPAPAPPPTSAVRTLTPDDVEQVGVLMHDAYAGTIDDEGEDVDQWIEHAREVTTGQYGQFLGDCSFVTPARPPFVSGVLAIENAPGCATIAQVMTRRGETNRGHARRLMTFCLAALVAKGYGRCFLEVTLANANAIHLYRSLGFGEIGPHIIFALRLLRE